jgi:DNA-directed RNA polymerase III subunit RPC6
MTSEANTELIDQVTTQIVALAQGKVSISNDDIKNGLADVVPEIRVLALNKLIQQGMLEVLKKGEALVYR